MLVLTGPGYGEFKTDMETIFERIARIPSSSSSSSTSLPSLSDSNSSTKKKKSAVIDHGNPSNWYGKKADLCIGCESDEDVLEGLKRVFTAEGGASASSNVGGGGGDGDDGNGGDGEGDGRGYSLVFARLTELADGLGCEFSFFSRFGCLRSANGRFCVVIYIGITPKNAESNANEGTSINPPSATASQDPQTKSAPSEESKTDPTTLFLNLDNRLKEIYTSLPVRSALIIMTGHGDPRVMAEMGRRRTKFEAAYRSRSGGSQVGGGGGVVSGVAKYLNGGGGGGGGGSVNDGKLRDPETGEELRWTSEDVRKLEDEVERTKRGLMFVCVKK